MVDLKQQAWETRLAHGSKIKFSVPGAKKYKNKYFINDYYSFVNLSVTGSACTCQCSHCKAKLLETMVPATTPDDMHKIINFLVNKGCRGILVSGGANKDGQVPLTPFINSLAYAKERGLKVLVHTGLINRDVALQLKQAGVDQVLMDIIGDERTIREVYHLERTLNDYLISMEICAEVGLSLAPHVVIGLHYGKVLGEMKALEMIKMVNPQIIVLVILSPTQGTDMAQVKPPSLNEVAAVFSRARIENPCTPIALGCARPSGLYKKEVEKLAIDCGVNGIAFPDEDTVEYAKSKGLVPIFTEDCCSLGVDKKDC